MIDIWESRVCCRPAVWHGCATLFIAWRFSGGRWKRIGCYWSRAEAEHAAGAA